jgi:2-oxoglutarate dehydrogenase E1 component
VAPQAPQIGSENLAFVEAMYEQYLENPTSVDSDWQALFSEWEDGSTARLEPSFSAPPLFRSGGTNGHANGTNSLEMQARQDRVDQLIRAYRVRGHMTAKLDPLGIERHDHPELRLSHYGLTESDLDEVFSARTMPGSPAQTLRNILEHLQSTYCRSIGVQFMHIDDLRTKEWLQKRVERDHNRLTLDRQAQIRILTKLTDAEIFEDFLQKKFLGAKRFSLEGGETLIPLLDSLIEEAAEHGVEEIVLGMAHRGRLNVLANTLGKAPAQIFREFRDADPELHIGRGDVKYHIGHSSDLETSTGRRVHVSLCFNPSHLEFVNPVVLGRVRAKADRMGDDDFRREMGVLIHGDSAFAGEGVVQETLNMSGLPGYATGGTIHIIVNNQIGFTTPPESARTSPYASDVAKLLQIPVFHVNGEDPEAVTQVLKIATEFRSIFKKDVVIDMYCYRKYGHNEGDDPAFTQPLMYRAIRKRSTVRESYMENIIKLGALKREDCEDIAVKRRQHLEEELVRAQAPGYKFELASSGRGLWSGMRGGLDADTPRISTAMGKSVVSDLLKRQTELPESFTPHPKIKRLLKNRAEMADGTRMFDWGGAEVTAFGSLLAAGYRVRISGQDSGRGTFSHRHSVLHDYESGTSYTPLCHLDPEQADFEVWDSPLSENGPLGFEWGYSLDCPDGLIVWEAQFGDFANVAQVIIDQFIVSSEDKWQRLSGLVLLLPHGFEGQGPEHSSARLERYLAMAAEDNIQVVNLTTPANYFHCLRRQVMRPYRKPLIVMSPKSLLRHPKAVSSLEDLAEGEFQRIIGDDLPTKKSAVKRVLLCSGKIFYELHKEREERGIDDIAIVRIEQLYPLSDDDLTQALCDYPDDTDMVWVQEEPSNMGAWPYWRWRFGDRLLERWTLRGLTRLPSASPATGSGAAHKLIQSKLLTRAFDR